MPWREPDDPKAWADLDEAEYRDIWDRLYATLDFRPSVKPELWPSFREPSESVTWDLRPMFANFADAYEATELEVAARLRDALDAAKGDDEFVYALEWQKPGYRFVPSLARAPQRTDSWLVPVIPDGDYYLFVARDLRFGWLSHPWEASVCVYGDLVALIGPTLTRLGWTVRRQGGIEQHRHGPRK